MRSAEVTQGQTRSSVFRWCQTKWGYFVRGHTRSGEVRKVPVMSEKVRWSQARSDDEVRGSQVRLGPFKNIKINQSIMSINLRGINARFLFLPITNSRYSEWVFSHALPCAFWEGLAKLMEAFKELQVHISPSSMGTSPCTLHSAQPFCTKSV